ncbi:dihydrolipoyl dehydrogenase [bacterium]|nr:dihydrolipoyl dehydrogenase [bacterium]
MTHFDAIIIGAGSAGYNAARILGANGKSVAMVDKGPLGGLCILRGCMPTKTMLRSTDVLQLIRDADELGIQVDNVRADFSAIMARQHRLVKGFQDYRIEGIHRAPNATLIQGAARFTGPDRIEVDGVTYTADRFLISTGSTPSIPEVPGLAEAGYITSDEAMSLTRLPASMVVWGGGVIALELGQFYARLGVAVTMLLRGEHVLSREDEDVQAVVEAALEADGITLLRNARPLSVVAQDGLKVMTLAQGDRTVKLEAEEILVATGRKPLLAPLDLEAAGVEAPGGSIKVDGQMRTTNPAIFAAGDCLGDFFLVHVAIQQAEVAAHNMLGKTPARTADYRLLASAIYTDPNVARVGLSEKDAAAQGREVLVGKYDFADLGKAECMGKGAMQGFVKLLADPSTGEILGASIVGPEGADLIHELIVAMEFRCTAERLMQIPHLHPTLAEIITYPAEEIAEARAERALAIG